MSIITKSTIQPTSFDRACLYRESSMHELAADWRWFSDRASNGLRLQAQISQRARALDRIKAGDVLPRRESRTLRAASTPPAGVANPPNSAPATVATAGTFWTRFLAMPSLDWVESWAFIGPSLVAALAALALKVSP